MPLALRRARLAAFQTAAAGSTAASALDITAIRGFPLREPVSGSRYTVVRVETRSGLVGYGESRVSANDLAQVQRVLVGKPAGAVEAIRAQLRQAPVTQAAVNMALLDILGK